MKIQIKLIRQESVTCVNNKIKWTKTKYTYHVQVKRRGRNWQIKEWCVVLWSQSSTELDTVLRRVVQSKDTPDQQQLNMDLAASTAATSGAQSIEWLFKKERMYLLAQFWQQVRASAIKLLGGS